MKRLAGAPLRKAIADSPHIFPITDKVRQVDNHRFLHRRRRPCHLHRAKFPEKLLEPHRVRLRADRASDRSIHLPAEKAADFTARDDFNLLASDDEWAAPIAAEVGPDGAVWMIDWYNYIVQHNPIPKGWVAGKGGAYETP